MQITIENSFLKLTVDTLGAQMMALEGIGGTQYLWDGDPRYWKGRAPTLFPFIGRLNAQSYRLNGEDYSMGIHGFASKQEFAVQTREKDRLTLCLTENAQTLEQYPFAFRFSVTYALEGKRLNVGFRVENCTNQTMPFGIGGHPGFRVPLVRGERFEDYVLEFSKACRPDRVGFTEQVLLSGVDTLYPLEDDRRIRLRHDLFDDDAIILKNMDRTVTLRSEKSGAGLTVSAPGMPYLGFWHMPKTDAPYICIEPWSSLPARQDVAEEFTCKSDLIQLEPRKTYETQWSVTIL